MKSLFCNQVPMTHSTLHFVEVDILVKQYILQVLEYQHLVLQQGLLDVILYS